MFYSITGEVVYFDAQSVAVSCGGVAFKCLATMNTLKKVAEKGSTVTLYTYLNVGENMLDLYGFYTETEMECFKLLLSVSGVGPKAALSVLSELTPDQFALAVASGDLKAIQRANGVGKRIADRILLELKDKIAQGLDLGTAGVEIESAAGSFNSSNTSDAVEVLTQLGFSQSDAASTVGRLDKSLSSDELVKQALKQLSRMG